MWKPIESMECRRLLSAAPNPANVPADESAVWFDIERIYSDVYNAGTKLGGDAQAISIDIKQLGSSPQLQALTQALNNDLKQSASTLWTDAMAVFKAGATDAWAVVDDGIQLFIDQWVPSAFPGAQTKLATDEANLQTAIAPSVAILKQDFAKVQTTITNDVQAIANAFPSNTQLQTDSQTFSNDVNSTDQTLQTDGQTFANDVATLINDKFGTA